MYELRPITYAAACEFVNNFHRHHKATTGCRYCLALYDKGALIAVAICGRPVSRYLDDGLTLEINRLCVLDGYYNACSQLYAACCRVAKATGYKKAITYTLQSESGASCKAANFNNMGVAGGTHWTGSRNKGQAIPAEYKIRWERNL